MNFEDQKDDKISKKNTNKSSTSKSTKSNTERYNESNIVKKFLNSKDGIKFLINSQSSKVQLDSTILDTNNTLSDKNNIYKRIDDFIDFYTCWTRSFPTRKNLKVSKYEYLKSVEDFCSKNEISEIFAQDFD